MAKRKNTKLRKHDIRKLWILKALLDCDQWTPKDIKKTWYLMSVNQIYLEKCDSLKGYISESVKKKALEKVQKKYKNYLINDHDFDVPEDKEKKIKEDFKNYAIELTCRKLDKIKKNFNDIDKMCKSDITKILGELHKKDIINDKVIIKKVVSKHAQPTGIAYTLIESYDVLFLILDEFNNPIIPSTFKSSLLSDLMSSEYLKRVVNEELVKTIETKLGLSLNDEDKKLLLFCLMKYSTVLYNTLNEIYKPLPPLASLQDSKRVTNSLMLDVKNWAYNDMKSGRYSVEYEITVTINDANGRIIKHTNSNTIHDPKEEEYKEKSARAQLEALTGVDLNLNNKPIKKDAEYKELVDMWQNLTTNLNNIAKHQTEYVTNEIKDETVFIKDNGKEINFLELYVPGGVYLLQKENFHEDFAPY